MGQLDPRIRMFLEFCKKQNPEEKLYFDDCNGRCPIDRFRGFMVKKDHLGYVEIARLPVSSFKRLERLIVEVDTPVGDGNYWLLVQALEKEIANG